MNLSAYVGHVQWRQRLGNFGGWIDAKGKVSWGRKSPPSGVQDEDPIGLVEMDVKLELVLSTVTNPIDSL